MTKLKEILEDVLTNGGSYEQEIWRRPGQMETIEADGADVCTELMHGETGHFEAVMAVRYPDVKITTETVDSYGGEDQGSEYYHVWKFVLQEDGLATGQPVEYIRFDGCYASHYGTDYEGYKYVRPTEKIVIVYE
jgi:hypothetical protein